MDNEFGLKELYSVKLKTTYPIEINGVIIEEGEVVAEFDKIQIANFQEVKKVVTARGGFDNMPRVFWESTKEVRLSFVQGIFSKVQFALMSNSKLIHEDTANKKLLISKREKLESDEEGKFYLTEQPVGKIFVYEASGMKIGSLMAGGRVYSVGTPFIDLIVDYNYEYTNNSTRMVVGQRLINGYLTLEGKTRVKDDITGQTKTGIIKIPKLKLMSDLSMKLGENAAPLTGHLDAIACPSGDRNQPVVMEIFFLDDDIDSDM